MKNLMKILKMKLKRKKIKMRKLIPFAIYIQPSLPISLQLKSKIFKFGMNFEFIKN